MTNSVSPDALRSRERLACGADDEPASLPLPAAASRRPAAELDYSDIVEWHAPMAQPLPTSTATDAPGPQSPVTRRGPALPVAPDAFRGVRLAWLAEALPRTDGARLGDSIAAGDYRLHAQIQKQADGSDA